MSEVDDNYLRPCEPTGINGLDDLRRLAALLRTGLDHKPTHLLRMMDEALLRAIGKPSRDYRKRWDEEFPAFGVVGGKWSPNSVRVMLARHAYDIANTDETPPAKRDAALVFVAAVAALDEVFTKYPSTGGLGSIQMSYRSADGTVKDISQATPLVDLSVLLDKPRVTGFRRASPRGDAETLLNTQPFSQQARQFAEPVRDGILDPHKDEPGFLVHMREALTTREQELPGNLTGPLQLVADVIDALEPKGTGSGEVSLHAWLRNVVEVPAFSPNRRAMLASALTGIAMRQSTAWKLVQEIDSRFMYPSPQSEIKALLVPMLHRGKKDANLRRRCAAAALALCGVPLQERVGRLLEVLKALEGFEVPGLAKLANEIRYEALAPEKDVQEFMRRLLDAPTTQKPGTASRKQNKRKRMYSRSPSPELPHTEGCHKKCGPPLVSQPIMVRKLEENGYYVSLRNLQRKIADTRPEDLPARKQGRWRVNLCALLDWADPWAPKR